MKTVLIALTMFMIKSAFSQTPEDQQEYQTGKEIKIENLVGDGIHFQFDPIRSNEKSENNRFMLVSSLVNDDIKYNLVSLGTKKFRFIAIDGNKNKILDEFKSADPILRLVSVSKVIQEKNHYIYSVYWRSVGYEVRRIRKYNDRYKADMHAEILGIKGWNIFDSNPVADSPKITKIKIDEKGEMIVTYSNGESDKYSFPEKSPDVKRNGISYFGDIKWLQ